VDAGGTLGESIGDSVARFRKVRNLSQERLAELAGVGVDTIARLEQGKRSSSRPATLRKLSSALGITVDTLVGRTVNDHSAEQRIMGLRRAITAKGQEPDLEGPADLGDTIELNELELDTRRSWHAYVDGRHNELLTTLPVILLDAHRLVESGTNDQKATACRFLSIAYRLGAGISSRLGFTDLSWLSAERALYYARFCDSPDLETAISLRYLAWTLVRQERFDEAEHVATAAAERIQPAMLDRDPERAGVFGNLLFNAASAAVLAGRPARADDLLTEAQAAAIRSKADFANEAAIFGPRVAAMQRVDQVVRTGDSELALHLADSSVVVTGHVAAFWEAGYNLCLAAAATDLRKDRRALAHLARANELAPGWAPHQPLGRRTMRRLVDRAARRRGEEFSRLAALYDVLPACTQASRSA
jgi:transcriptional regulator with XRE-family HTH domain